MNDIDVQITAKGEEAGMLTKCIRYLLDKTFMMRDKETRLFNFAARVGNQSKLSDYFSVAGFKFILDETEGVCGIQPDKEIEEDAGVKQLSKDRFSADQYYVILVLWSIWLERSCRESCVKITITELIDELKTFGIVRKAKGLHGILNKLKEKNMVYFKTPYTDETDIILYPTIMFGYSEDEFKAAVDQIMSEEQASETDDPDDGGYIEDADDDLDLEDVSITEDEEEEDYD